MKLIPLSRCFSDAAFLNAECGFNAFQHPNQVMLFQNSCYVISKFKSCYFNIQMMLFQNSCYVFFDFKSMLFQNSSHVISKFK